MNNKKEIFDSEVDLAKCVPNDFCGQRDLLLAVLSNGRIAEVENYEQITKNEVDCVLQSTEFWENIEAVDYEKILSIFKIWGNSKERRKDIFDALRKKEFLDERGNNLLLQKIEKIVDYHDSPEKFKADYVYESAYKKLDKKEYQKALYKRGNSLLAEARLAEEKIGAKELLNDRRFEEEVLLFGSFFRGLVHLFKQDYNEVSKCLKNSNACEISGGDLVKDIFKCVQTSNYLHPESFGVADFLMVQKNSEDIYSKEFPLYKDVLLLNFAKSLNNEFSRIFTLKFNELIGVRRIEKRQEDLFKSATFYIAKEFRNDFSMGAFFDRWVDESVPINTIFEATMANIENIIAHHLAHGRKIVGTTKERAKTGSGEILESEVVWKTVRKVTLN